MTVDQAEVVSRIRELLVGECASCHETSGRTGLARPLVDAVWRHAVGQGALPEPCERCRGRGYNGDGNCKACQGRGCS